MFDNNATLLSMFKVLSRVTGEQSLSIRSQPFTAIFDDGYSNVLGIVESTEPSLLMRTSDVTALAIVKDDVVNGLAIQWRVKHFEPDGTGITRVVLKK